MSDDGDGYVEVDAASEAFKRLGSETRVAILRAFLEPDEEGRVAPTTRTFSELHEASGESTSAGFAYHLRQLVGHYVRKDEAEETYSLTYAGVQAAREVATGTYTESVDRDPVALADDCPLCGESALELRVADNVGRVACEGCEREVLALPFPPAGFRNRDEASLPAAFDRHHRHRIALLADGNCPECGGAVERSVETLGADDGADDADVDDGGDADPRPSPVRAVLDCETCGYGLRCPVTLTLLDHPAVVAFYRDHDVSLDDRPVWNVGTEWAERRVSTDPVAVRVTTELDGEVLSLFVGRDLTVVHEERREAETDATDQTDPTDAETDRDSDSAAA